MSAAPTMPLLPRAARGPNVERRTFSAARSAAFTLVEMLVAVALLGMIASLLFFSLDQVSRATASGLGKATMYQDLRTVADQMSRELQQAIPFVAVDGFGNTNSIFVGRTTLPQGTAGNDAQVHFVATIDNNTGYEEVEVHYMYDGTNTLWKAFAYGSTNTTTAWDFQSPSAFDNGLPGIASGTWGRTPLPYSTDYSPVLYGVKSCTFQFSSDPATLTNSNVALTKDWLGRGPSIPSYVKVSLVVFDAAVLRRWGSADQVPVSLTNLARSSTFFVQLPRSVE